MKTAIFSCLLILLLSYSSCESETENMPVEKWTAYKVIRTEDFIN